MYSFKQSLRVYDRVAQDVRVRVKSFKLWVYGVLAAWFQPFIE